MICRRLVFDNRKVRIRVNNKLRLSKSYNVIGTIQGYLEPGKHRSSKPHQMIFKIPRLAII